MKKLIPLAAAAIVMAGTITAAQTTSHDKHGSHGAPASKSAKTAKAAPSTAAYRAANDKMHAGMDIAYTGDADVDFMRGMIPHHQGAIDMAKVVLQHGKDPAIRKLAQDIIAAQEREIGEMQAWLKTNAK